MEKEIGEIFAALALLIVALAGLIRFIPWWFRRVQEGERSARKELEIELRHLITLGEGRIADLEAKHNSDKGRIASLEIDAAKVPELDRLLRAQTQRNDGLESQLTTLCTQIEGLQKQADEAEQRDHDKQAEIARKDRTIKELETQNAALFEANKSLVIERNTYRQALALVGIERAERESMEHKPQTNELAGELSGELAETKGE